MSMDMFVVARGELSDDAARDAVDAMCARLPGVSVAWDGGAFGGVMSFWRADLLSIERDDITEQLPAELQHGTRKRALVVSGSA
jgi:hypothetical protein